jgi:hypothetical protein
LAEDRIGGNSEILSWEKCIVLTFGQLIFLSDGLHKEAFQRPHSYPFLSSRKRIQILCKFLQLILQQIIECVRPVAYRNHATHLTLFQRCHHNEGMP